MTSIVNLKTFSDGRGNLTVIEKVVPFNIRRIFYIYNVGNSTRGHHRHRSTIQAAVSIQGSCSIWSKNKDYGKVKEYVLDKPDKCLIIKPEDYHWMDNFSDNCILMVFASEYYDEKDYIYEKYED
jgi:dTDP-4-dehydrorhamnose 3,5-epimerase-like enzyme